MAEWTDDNVIRFINIYQLYPVLWDPQHPHYKLLNKKQTAWTEVSKSMDGTAVDELKKKMQNLMSSFRRERQKVKKTKLNRTLYTGNWFAFQHFSFLHERYKVRDQNEKGQPDFEMIKMEQREDVQETVAEEETGLSEDDKSSWPQFGKRKRVPESRSSADTMVNCVCRLNRDKFDKYVEYLAEELRQLDSHSVVHVQKAFGDVIFQAKLGKYKARNVTSSCTEFPHSAYSPSSSWHRSFSNETPSPTILSADANCLSSSNHDNAANNSDANE